MRRPSHEQGSKVLKVALLQGGIGSEREVSLRSGKACHTALEQLGHEVLAIDFQGKAQLQDLMASKADIAFIALHGEFGEDGAVQGLLDILEMSYTGSGKDASSLCMNKYLSKLNFQARGLPVAPCLVQFADQDFSKLTDDWQCEYLFTKPVSGGSSVGARVLHNATEFDEVKGLEGYLLEPFVQGREVTLSFLESDQGWQMLPILELRAKGEFYDYHCKYTEGQTEFILPAPMEDSRVHELEDIGRCALEANGVSGYGRVDMLLEDEKSYIMEINTLPGMTELSDMPAQAREAGMSFEELINRILSNAKG